MFDIKFLGKGAAFYPQFGNTNGFFAKNSDIFFTDFGESAYEKALRLVKPYEYGHTYVLLTHLHADHCGSLASLISYMYFTKGKKVTVVHPETTIMDLLALQGISRDYYDYTPELPPEAGFGLEFIKVIHADAISAYGMLLADEDETVYYSGDAAYLPADICERFLNGDIRRIYHDTASHESAAHCWYKRLVDAVPQNKRGDVYCMHFDSDCVDMIKELGFSVVECIE